MVLRPPKGTPLRGTASFDVFCVKIGARVSAVAFLKSQKKYPSHLLPTGAKSRMRRTETPKPIWIKFGTLVDIPDVVTYTNFGDHRLRGFWVAGGQISPSPIDFRRRPYNTLALPCDMGASARTPSFWVPGRSALLPKTLHVPHCWVRGSSQAEESGCS